MPPSHQLPAKTVETKTANAGSNPEDTEKKAQKPPLSYSALVLLAISSNPERKLTLREIYYYIRQNFPYYRENRETAWQNNIKQILVKNKYFVKLPPPSGTGCNYWTFANNVILYIGCKSGKGWNPRRQSMPRRPNLKSGDLLSLVCLCSSRPILSRHASQSHN